MTTLHTPEQLYEDADELLSAADYELHRVQENMVSHLVCNNARLSITHYLIGFLIEKNIPVLTPGSFASLQQQCQAIDPRFHRLELDDLTCRYETPGKRHCLDIDQLNACVKAANEIRSIILNQAVDS